MQFFVINILLLLNIVITDQAKDVAFQYLLKKQKQMSLNDIISVTDVQNLHFVGECGQKINSYKVSQKIAPNCKEEYVHIGFEYKYSNGTLIKVSGYLTPYSTLEKLQLISNDKYCKKIKRSVFRLLQRFLRSRDVNALRDRK